MYQKRYPALFNNNRSYIQPRAMNRSTSQPALKHYPPLEPESMPPQKNNVTIIEPQKTEPIKEIISEPEKPKEEIIQEPKKVKQPLKPRAQDKRRKKTDDELREKFLSKLCKSKKLTASEQTINEIQETLEQAEHNPDKLREIEKETRKKLRILKNSYLFIDKDNEKAKEKTKTKNEDNSNPVEKENK